MICRMVIHYCNLLIKLVQSNSKDFTIVDLDCWSSYAIEAILSLRFFKQLKVMAFRVKLNHIREAFSFVSYATNYGNRSVINLGEYWKLSRL